jgi:hypothetical protein
MFQKLKTWCYYGNSVRIAMIHRDDGAPATLGMEKKSPSTLHPQAVNSSLESSLQALNDKLILGPSFGV